MKSQKYTIDEIFEKKLYFLFPFVIFSYEKRFKKYNEGQKNIALNLYRAGIPVENIAQYAEVSVEQVEKWISSDEPEQKPLAA